MNSHSASSFTTFIDPYVTTNPQQLISSGKAVPYIGVYYNSTDEEYVKAVFSKNPFLQKSQHVVLVKNNYVVGLPIIGFFGQIYHQVKKLDELTFLTSLIINAPATEDYEIPLQKLNYQMPVQYAVNEQKLPKIQGFDMIQAGYVQTGNNSLPKFEE